MQNVRWRLGSTMRITHFGFRAIWVIYGNAAKLAFLAPGRREARAPAGATRTLSAANDVAKWHGLRVPVYPICLNLRLKFSRQRA
jgi:hypothetical protein